MTKDARSIAVGPGGCRFGAWVLLLGLVAGCGPSPPTIVERAALKGHTREVSSLAFAPDGSTLASRSADSVRVWDVVRGGEPSTFPSDGAENGSVAYAPDGRTLASDRAGVGAIARDLATGIERAPFVFPGAGPGASGRPGTRGWGLAYSPDGKTLAGGGSHGREDGSLALWDTANGRAVLLPPVQRPITTVAFSTDGRTVASGSMDGSLVLWDPASRRQRLTIQAGRSYLAPVRFSVDGRMVASANESRWVKLWDVADGREVGSLKGHIKAVLSMAFSPDGRTLVTGDSGGTLFAWDLASRRLLTRVETPGRGKVWALAFSPDGQTLASTGQDRLVHLWDVTWPRPSGGGH